MTLGCVVILYLWILCVGKTNVLFTVYLFAGSTLLLRSVIHVVLKALLCVYLSPVECTRSYCHLSGTSQFHGFCGIRCKALTLGQSNEL